MQVIRIMLPTGLSQHPWGGNVLDYERLKRSDPEQRCQMASQHGQRTTSQVLLGEIFSQGIIQYVATVLAS